MQENNIFVTKNNEQPCGKTTGYLNIFITTRMLSFLRKQESRDVE